MSKPLPRGVYSDREIFEAYERGDIIIDPFNPENVKGSSYDVSLGGFYYRTEARAHGGAYNPFSELGVARYFGELQVAEPHRVVIKRNGLQPFENIPLDHPIILLGPGERILGHTDEFIGVRGKTGTTMMKARSTWGRNGVSVCHDAGWGDPGYVNRWTMEILNLNQSMAVPLPVGARVGQLIFFHTGVVDKPYSSKYQEAQQGGDVSSIDLLAAVKLAWRPDQMLPKAYKDKLTPPVKLAGLSIDETFKDMGDEHEL